MSTVFLPKKRTSLYARLTVPLALPRYFNGRSEVWRSLKTLDKDEYLRTEQQRWDGNYQDRRPRPALTAAAHIKDGKKKQFSPLLCEVAKFMTTLGGDRQIHLIIKDGCVRSHQSDAIDV